MFSLPHHHFLPQVQIDRRDFLRKSGLGVLALTIPLPTFPKSLKDTSMGIVVHSYAHRWHSTTPSEDYPGFNNALGLIAHCKEIGAGGVQTLVSGWSLDFAKQVRDARENAGLYLEGSIVLPKSREELTEFESEVIAAKEAGASVVRTACLGGRRYEDFNTMSEYKAFRAKAIRSIERAEPIVRKHRIKLAIENHKDWACRELRQIINKIGSIWVGVTLDFGNNISLMETPEDVIKTLAPIAFSTHVKDMGIKNYNDGFLLSEVPLGEGVVDLKAAVELCKKYNSKINFNLEMITRDPLEIPCMKESYWNTFDHLSGLDVYRMERFLDENQFQGDLLKVSDMSKQAQLAYEEKHVLACLSFSRSSLGLL